MTSEKTVNHIHKSKMSRHPASAFYFILIKQIKEALANYMGFATKSQTRDYEIDLTIREIVR